MVTLDDYYALVEVVDLKPESEESFGKAIIRYEVRKYQNVSNLGSKNAYLVSMTQRVLVPNQQAYEPGAQSISSYSDYPALLKSSVDITCPTGMKMCIKNLFPRTLNANVSVTKSSGDSSNTSTSHESTSGSSTANVNTYDVSTSIGFFGDMPTGSVGFGYSHSTENATSRSSSTGGSSGNGHSVGNDATMSVKDWSCYSQLDHTTMNPSWVWGQGYPWDVIVYNQSGNGDTVQLPTFVQNRLLTSGTDGDYLLPPSELSLFGVDFTMKASWLFELEDGATFDDSVSISHTTEYLTASHGISSAGALYAELQTEDEASMATNPVKIPSLSAFALNPLGLNVNGGSIGFSAYPFLAAPSSADAEFKIVSPANNLQVTGTGFTSGLTTDFSVNPTLEITFKVADTTTDYSLHLMHWIGAGSGSCELAWKVNNNDNYKGAILVSATEGQGGEGNISSVELRNSDYSSISFHDYLVLGTNTIHIDLSKMGSDSACEYTLFAVAVTA